jgi:hypothetical protein
MKTSSKLDCDHWSPPTSSCHNRSNSLLSQQLLPTKRTEAPRRKGLHDLVAQSLAYSKIGPELVSRRDHSARGREGDRGPAILERPRSERCVTVVVAEGIMSTFSSPVKSHHLSNQRIIRVVTFPPSNAKNSRAPARRAPRGGAGRRPAAAATYCPWRNG